MRAAAWDAVPRARARCPQSPTCAAAGYRSRPIFCLTDGVAPHDRTIVDTVDANDKWDTRMWLRGNAITQVGITPNVSPPPKGTVREHRVPKFALTQAGRTSKEVHSHYRVTDDYRKKRQIWTAGTSGDLKNVPKNDEF